MSLPLVPGLGMIILSQLFTDHERSYPNATGMIGAPVIEATLITPSFTFHIGPRGPSGVIARWHCSFSIVFLIVNSAFTAPREEEPPIL